MTSKKLTAFNDFCKRKAYIEQIKTDLAKRKELLILARGLALAPLPYKKSNSAHLQRIIRIGQEDRLIVTYAALKPGISLPYGKDRALLGWIQTLAKQKPDAKGFVMFDHLTDFFRAFDLHDGGEYYRWFKASLNRIQNLAVSIELHHAGVSYLENCTPVKKAFLPQDPKEARIRAREEHLGQLTLFKPPYQHPKHGYGFQLQADFWDYLSSSPVVLPLPIMKLFTRCPRGWDFAQFVFIRCGLAETESLVPWEALFQTIGTQDKDKKRLRNKLRKHLSTIHEIYPNCPANFLKQGLLVTPWRWMDDHAWPQEEWIPDLKFKD